MPLDESGSGVSSLAALATALSRSLVKALPGSREPSVVEAPFAEDCSMAVWYVASDEEEPLCLPLSDIDSMDESMMAGSLSCDMAKGK